MAFGEVVVKLDSFSTLLADKCARSALDPGCFIPGESAPSYPLNRMDGWMGTTVGLGAAVKARYSYPCRKFNHDFSVVQPEDIPTEVPWHFSLSGIYFLKRRYVQKVCSGKRQVRSSSDIHPSHTRRFVIKSAFTNRHIESPPFAAWSSMIARIERGKGKGVPMPQYDVIGAMVVVIHVLHTKYCVQVCDIRVVVTPHICVIATIKNPIVQLVAE